MQPARVARIRRRTVAGLVCPVVDLESLPAKAEHLGHKRHPVELSLAVERPQDFFLAPDFHPVADAQFSFPVHIESTLRLDG